LRLRPVWFGLFAGACEASSEGIQALARERRFSVVLLLLSCDVSCETTAPSTCEARVRFSGRRAACLWHSLDSLMATLYVFNMLCADCKHQSQPQRR